MGYFFEEELMMLIPGLITGIPTGLFGIASYILTAAAIYIISRRRGLNKPWLAWVPVVNCWLLGSLSDQYCYVVRGETTSRRKWLLGLNLAQFALGIAVTVLGIVSVGSVMMSRRPEVWMGPVIGLLGVVLPLCAVKIASFVIRCIALYDVFRSLDPSNSVLYLVLSILFSPTEPFFLFFNRDKDLGMPPRKHQNVQEPAPQAAEDYEYV